MKKTNIFGAAAATLVASAFMVACGPTLSEQIPGSYLYEDSVEEPETEKEFAMKRTISETDTFGEDKSYSEEGTITRLYYINDSESGENFTITMSFNYRRTGTWKVEYENGEDWLVITGKETTWELGEYICPNSEMADYAWNLATESLEDYRTNDEKDWTSEHNYTISSVDENEFVYETKSETVHLKRIKDNQDTAEKE